MTNVLQPRWWPTTVVKRVLATSMITAVVLLGASALLVATPDAAHAGTPNCPYYNFCLWDHIGYDGGRYNWSGSDANLCNDYFVGTRTIVCNNASSVQNNGSPQTFDDVLVRDGGATLCVPRGAAYPDLRAYGWNDRIDSYSWVRNTTC